MCSHSIYINSKSKSAMRSSPPSHWKLTASAPSCHRNFSVSLVLRIFKIFDKDSTFMPNDIGRSPLNSNRRLPRQQRHPRHVRAVPGLNLDTLLVAVEVHVLAEALERIDDLLPQYGLGEVSLARPAPQRGGASSGVIGGTRGGDRGGTNGGALGGGAATSAAPGEATLTAALTCEANPATIPERVWSSMACKIKLSSDSMSQSFAVRSVGTASTLQGSSSTRRTRRPRASPSASRRP